MSDDGTREEGVPLAPGAPVPPPAAPATLGRDDQLAFEVAQLCSELEASGHERKALLAQVEALREALARSSGVAGRLSESLKAAAEARDVAQAKLAFVYGERDRCVALIARMALALGLRAGLGRHEGGDWEEDWRYVVYVDLPAGQVSWHIHDSELQLFGFLPAYTGAWDGHGVQEKYRRVVAPGDLGRCVAPGLVLPTVRASAAIPAAAAPAQRAIAAAAVGGGDDDDDLGGLEVDLSPPGRGQR